MINADYLIRGIYQFVFSFSNCEMKKHSPFGAVAGARILPLGLLFLPIAFSSTVLAQTVVPAGASYQMSGGAIDLGCTDLQVSGSLVEGSGASLVGARNVLVQSGGELDISAAALQLAQDYSNQGVMKSVGGVMTRVDSPGCPAKGALGPVNLSGTSTPATFVPVPGLHGFAPVLLSLAVAIWTGLRLRSKR
ncbi:hypothetical protein G7047_09645 [Diaphorobacter sp. HDW4A]|uniref:hypothetical protein n=1 Tax=Diaphorobacter sp. HDW4A TaxID=2714924 RepID=UPI00140CBAAF|nr:hypothetical protein [Diaphorobacter sp. HDW4A]QIL80138.1 hypothetical protein G7047_09645 [Diaphorobacter sp. HDW4A]